MKKILAISLFVNLKGLLFFYICLQLIPNFILAKDSINTINFINYPKEIPKWELVSYLGLSVAYLPKIIVEEELNQSPLIEANFRFGLPYNFDLNARISSIYITNQFTLGLQWCHSFDKFAFSLGFNYSYWLCQFKQPAFNVIANGTMNYPFITLGYDFDDFYVSLKTEAIISTFEETFIGETTTGGIQKELVGWIFSYSLEQPLFKKMQIFQSVRINLTKFYYQSWIAFTKTKNYIIFPEFVIGFKL